nr:hypothetical protein [Cellulomonas sp.]
MRALLLPRDAALGLEPEPVSGLAAVVADGLAEPDPPEGTPLDREEPPAREPTRVRAVPYFAWGNRGQGTMAVWVREA